MSIIMEGLALFNFEALKGTSIFQRSLILFLFFKIRIIVEPLTSHAFQTSIWRFPASVSNDMKLHC
jgi:hypothetical protein